MSLRCQFVEKSLCEWQIISSMRSTKQNDGYSCGVFVAMVMLNFVSFIYEALFVNQDNISA